MSKKHFLILITLSLFLYSTSSVEASIFGPIDTPPASNFATLENNGLTLFITRLVQLFFVLSGLYIMINIILAGYKYLTADGNAQALQQANAQIYNSFIGGIIIASSLLITAIISWIIFGDPTFILNPRIFGA